MADFDFSKMMESMSKSVDDGSNPIKAIYDIMPTYEPEQQQMLFVLQYFIDKWDLTHLKEMLDNNYLLMKNNKNLGFFGSKTLQNFLASYTQTDLIRGINIRSQKQDDITQGGNS